LRTQVLKHSKNCGCRPPAKTHGFARRAHRPPEYRIWKQIKTRCHNPRVPQWKDYGGRGIRISEEWDRDFTAFYRDVGPRPSPQHSIDRIDNNGPYTGPCAEYPNGNCRWATRAEQMSHTSRSLFLTFHGVTRTAHGWATVLNLKYGTIVNRLHRGWTIDETLATPAVNSRQLRRIAARRDA
jgi:hypothetical protein